jgi:hypothetical protein
VDLVVIWWWMVGCGDGFSTVAGIAANERPYNWSWNQVQGLIIKSRTHHIEMFYLKIVFSTLD